MPELIAPTARLHESWLSACAEWGPGVHQDGTGLGPEDDLDTPGGFAAWIARLAGESDPAVTPAPGRVHATYWWVADGDTYLGAFALRHALNDFLLQAGGHVGYSVRPSARRRGLATWALREVLPHARDLGLDRILITCDDANAASSRVIEKCGGVLENISDTQLGRTRRYWITL
jgi:predicted acetyltransferase